jgi:hypothetical protein
VTEPVRQAERSDVCWNCLAHKDIRVIGHGWYECEKCSVKWRRTDAHG